MAFSIEHTDDEVQVLLRTDDHTYPIPPIWLRERSTDLDQLDAISGQRLFDPHLLGPDLSIEHAQLDDHDRLTVRFSDGHCGHFDTHTLAAEVCVTDGLPEFVPWSSATMVSLPSHEWSAVRVDDATLRAAIGDFLRFGVIVIIGAPTTEGTVAMVAERFGYIRETNFGRIFDVRSVPLANDLAYTAGALGPHTDNPYRTPVPGIQLLHCLVNETTGGDSTLVDSIAAVERLRAEDQGWFEVLASTPVQFRFRDAATDLRSERTVIECDASGRVTGLNYSPRLDHLPLMSPARTRLYQQARLRLAELLRDQSLEVRFRLEPGAVEMFANDRILHGRSAYDSQQGTRHLQGCYIDADGPRSLYRVLDREHQNRG